MAKHFKTKQSGLHRLPVDLQDWLRGTSLWSGDKKLSFEEQSRMRALSEGAFDQPLHLAGQKPGVVPASANCPG